MRAPFGAMFSACFFSSRLNKPAGSNALGDFDSVQRRTGYARYPTEQAGFV